MLIREKQKGDIIKLWFREEEVREEKKLEAKNTSVLAIPDLKALPVIRHASRFRCIRIRPRLA
jgi:hypothetical protein